MRLSVARNKIPKRDSPFIYRKRDNARLRRPWLDSSRAFAAVYRYTVECKARKDLSVADEFVSVYCALWLYATAVAGCEKAREKF